MKYPIETIRHSTAHLLAAAVKNLFPETKLGIGPVIEDGFYYDFDLRHRISEKDFEKIEGEMYKLKSQKIPFVKIEDTILEAQRRSKILNEPLKLELIQDLKKSGEKKVSFYKTGGFEDLCRGPHVKDSSEIGEFKLLSIAGAYWKGSERNKMLQRVYGTAWYTKKELAGYLERVELAKERDHRKVGKELGLFVFSDLVGKGLPLFTSKGTTILRELERYIVDEELSEGYEHVVTPVLAKTDLYKTSGHYPYYKESMYPPMKIDEDELILRPMTCPHHFVLYNSISRSYRDLPIKFAEISPQFRYEKSGELSGLSRVRSFKLSDAHIFSEAENVEKILNDVLDLISKVNKALGFVKGEDFRFRLSLGDRSDKSKYFKNDKAWDKSEDLLRKILKDRKEPFYEAFGEAAFYGPKIDIQMKTVLGKEETIFTVQYDFVMPKRFNLTYTDNNGKAKEVVVIHRSSIGALERVVAFLLEKTGGALPTWLSPMQVAVLPIAERHVNYSQEVIEKLSKAKIRAEGKYDSDTLQLRIRQTQIQKIPFTVVVGDKEQVKKLVSVRQRGSEKIEVFDVDSFTEKLQDQIEKEKNG